MINIAVLGAAGRMGASIRALIDGAAQPAVRVSGAWDRQSSPGITSDLGKVLAGADVAIDFSHASATEQIVAAIAATPLPLVCGTTGQSPEGIRALQGLTTNCAVLRDGNMSVGVQLMCSLAAQAASFLADYDIEISETHHRFKRDAPSGTALKIGDAAARSRGQVLSDVARFNRHGDDAERNQGEIGFAVLRGGSVVGEHTLSLLGDWDALEIRHRALDRRLFAQGAVQAARWLIGKPPGDYNIESMLSDI